jgi:hypothetical protein
LSGCDAAGARAKLTAEHLLLHSVYPLISLVPWSPLRFFDIMRDRINRFQIPADVIARMHNASSSAASASPERPTSNIPQLHTLNREDTGRPIPSGTAVISSQTPKLRSVEASSSKRPLSQSFQPGASGSNAPASLQRESREVREGRLKEELQRLHTAKLADYEASLLTLPMTTVR